MNENPYKSPNEVVVPEDSLQPSVPSGGVFRSIRIWFLEETLSLFGLAAMVVGGIAIGVAIQNLWICIPLVVVYEGTAIWLFLILGRRLEAWRERGKSAEDIDP